MKTLGHIFCVLVGLSVIVAAGAWCYCAHSAATSPTKEITLEDLLDAIEQVKSGGDSDAIGRDGEVGSFQIKKIYVDDVNRICRLRAPNELYITIYEYDHRESPVLSRRMVKLYLRHYATKKRIGRTPTFEDMARIHNGGPNGWKKDCTKPYWEKVKKEIEQ